MFMSKNYFIKQLPNHAKRAISLLEGEPSTDELHIEFAKNIRQHERAVFSFVFSA